VLQGIDLAISPGKSLVIIGGSGTGKSVMLKCVLGLMKPDAGLDPDRRAGNHRRRSPNERDALMRKFGMLFQGGALFDSMRVWENVAFGLIQGRKAWTAARPYDIAIEKLQSVGLDESEVAHLFPAELSGGMQKRVGSGPRRCQPIRKLSSSTNRQPASIRSWPT
jgi:phospholipid/cholesterol/gamma-HCH transport system ATP-binding protein